MGMGLLLADIVMLTGVLLPEAVQHARKACTAHHAAKQKGQIINEHFSGAAVKHCFINSSDSRGQQVAYKRRTILAGQQLYSASMWAAPALETVNRPGAQPIQLVFQSMHAGSCQCDRIAWQALT